MHTMASKLVRIDTTSDNRKSSSEHLRHLVRKQHQSELVTDKKFGSYKRFDYFPPNYASFVTSKVSECSYELTILYKGAFYPMIGTRSLETDRLRCDSTCRVVHL
ncbi:unnamed protein product [Heterobilharzia americana]|nr:unnamed protein product [Heterobilharzia americana]CAH8608082.1 unnamed protein product [Heterobilharzia americana]